MKQPEESVWKDYDPDPPMRDESDPEFREELYLGFQAQGLTPADLKNGQADYAAWLNKPHVEADDK